MGGESGSFKLFEINHETGEVCIAFRRDFADLIAQGLLQSLGSNPCIRALAFQMISASDILIGQKRVGDCRDFARVEVVGKPPERPLPMVTRPVLVPIKDRRSM